MVADTWRWFAWKRDTSVKKYGSKRVTCENCGRLSPVYLLRQSDSPEQQQAPLPNIVFLSVRPLCKRGMKAHIIKSVHLRCLPTWHMGSITVPWTGYVHVLECVSDAHPKLLHLPDKRPRSRLASGSVPVEVGSGPAARNLQSLLKVSARGQELKMVSCPT